MIEAVIERCAGIDVGKKFLVVCVMTGPLEAEPKIEIRRFGTFVAELELLRDWLIRERCSHAVMESTGSYWKPAFNVLENSVEVVLANAYDVQNRRGHKTDPNDSRWLAHLLRHGMIRPSFIPERAIRELRDLTRRRRQLVGERARERNRIQKILEDANVKLGDVLSDVLGLSGRLMIDALLEGKPVKVANTPSVGCSTKWMYKEEGRKEELAEIEAQTVSVKSVNADGLKSLRKNASEKMILVNLWATWCGPCFAELPELENMYRMYGHRPFDLVTVSINYPDEKPGVLTALKKLHATSTNLHFGSTDIYDLMAAFDPNWNAAVPYTMLIKPGGEVVYKHQGSINPLELRRFIVANLPDDDYLGHQNYWKSAVSK